MIMALLVIIFGFIFAACAALAPRDAVASGGSVNFKSGTTGSKVMGYSFLGLLVGALALWWVT